MFRSLIRLGLISHQPLNVQRIPTNIVKYNNTTTGPLLCYILNKFNNENIFIRNSLNEYQTRPIHTKVTLEKRNRKGPRNTNKNGENTEKSSEIENLLEPSVPTLSPAIEKNKRTVMFEEGPYPENKRSIARFSYRPSIDPTNTSIVLFPGQGTQFVGMGREVMDYPSVAEMYAISSEILGFDLVKASLQGPDQFLLRTQIQQPAILVASLAAVEKLRHDNPKALENCVATAGFSVGEITALTFAGALAFEDAVQLVKVRAEAMQLASEMSPGGLLTVFYNADSRLGLCCETAKEYCARRGVINPECKIATHISPNCKVVGGSEEALEFIRDHIKDFKLKGVRRLKVSGAFHTSHMLPAKDALAEALSRITINSPKVPVHSNVDGKPYRDPKMIRNLLPKQVCKTVKWEQIMHILYERPSGTAFPATYECGPGKSCATMLKMVNEKAYSRTCNVRV